MKKNILLFGSILMLLVVCFNGCIEEETSDSLSNLGFRQYGFGLNPPEEFRFAHVSEIGLPEYWYVNESFLGYEVIFELEDSSFTKMGVSLSIIRLDFVKNNELVLRHVFDNSSFEDFASESMEMWYDMFTNVTYISNTTSKVNDMDAYISVFTGSLNDTDMYKQKHVYVEKNGIVFKIIYSAVENLYDEYIDDIDNSINSFTIQ